MADLEAGFAGFEDELEAEKQEGEEEEEDEEEELLLSEMELPKNTNDISLLDGTDFQWYVLQVYNGFELFCKGVIEANLSAWGLEDRVRQLVVPVYRSPVTRGKKVSVKEVPLYPSYIYCEVQMSVGLRDKFSRNCPRVVGFVGQNRDEDGIRIPDIMHPVELKRIFSNMEEGAKEPEVLNSEFGLGDMVEITQGPYKKERGALRIVRHNEFVVRLYAFGNQMDVSVPHDGLRRLTEEEVMEENAQAEEVVRPSPQYQDRRGQQGDNRRYDRDRSGPPVRDTRNQYQRDMDERAGGRMGRMERRARKDAGTLRTGPSSSRADSSWSTASSPLASDSRGAYSVRGSQDQSRTSAEEDQMSDESFFDSLDDLLFPDKKGDAGASSSSSSSARNQEPTGRASTLDAGDGNAGESGAAGETLSLDLDVDTEALLEDDFFEALMEELKTPQTGGRARGKSPAADMVEEPAGLTMPDDLEELPVMAPMDDLPGMAGATSEDVGSLAQGKIDPSSDLELGGPALDDFEAELEALLSAVPGEATGTAGDVAAGGAKAGEAALGAGDGGLFAMDEDAELEELLSELEADMGGIGIESSALGTDEGSPDTFPYAEPRKAQQQQQQKAQADAPKKEQAPQEQSPKFADSDLLDGLFDLDAPAPAQSRSPPPVPKPAPAPAPAPAQVQATTKAAQPDPVAENSPKDASASLEQLSKLKVTELKAELKAKGLKVSGKKAELVERLLEAKA
ncbi:unnamed protein product [Chrysoparadoxa australica]